MCYSITLPKGTSSPLPPVQRISSITLHSCKGTSQMCVCRYTAWLNLNLCVYSLCIMTDFRNIS